MEFSEVLNAGNPNDFKKIYDASMQMLFRISCKIVNDEDAAEDLVHDSLIKANEKELVFPSLNDAKYWLIRVVKNASLNYVKRKSREKKAYEKVLYENKHEFDSGEVSLLKKESKNKAIEALKLPICRIVADGGKFSDGEQRYLPILTNNKPTLYVQNQQ